MITSKKKPKKCPACGSKKVAKILWGLPAFSPELEIDLKEGKIVLGGCIISDNDPYGNVSTAKYRSTKKAGIKTTHSKLINKRFDPGYAEETEKLS